MTSPSCGFGSVFKEGGLSYTVSFHSSEFITWISTARGFYLTAPSFHWRCSSCLQWFALLLYLMIEVNSSNIKDHWITMKLVMACHLELDHVQYSTSYSVWGGCIILKTEVWLQTAKNKKKYIHTNQTNATQWSCDKEAQQNKKVLGGPGHCSIWRFNWGNWTGFAILKGFFSSKRQIWRVSN